MSLWVDVYGWWDAAETGFIVIAATSTDWNGAWEASLEPATYEDEVGLAHYWIRCCAVGTLTEIRTRPRLLSLRQLVSEENPGLVLYSRWEAPWGRRRRRPLRRYPPGGAAAAPH